MNCWKGQCKYCSDEKICKLDGAACDMTTNPIYGTGMTEYHCRQDKREDLCGYSADVCLIPDAPKMAFWSCENICKFYDTCTET